MRNTERITVEFIITYYGTKYIERRMTQKYSKLFFSLNKTSISALIGGRYFLGPLFEHFLLVFGSLVF